MNKKLEEKVVRAFADIMVKRIEEFKGDWHKPWFTEGTLGCPCSIKGRKYHGVNRVMLSMLCEVKNYSTPRFTTFKALQEYNRDEPEKPVLIKKGEKAFPVFYYITSYWNADGQITADEYDNLSPEVKLTYKRYVATKVLNVFNVEQTNIQETRPAIWSTWQQPNQRKSNTEQYIFPPLDTMIETDEWICPIKPQKQDQAYYSVSKNEIIIPMKEQFEKDEFFYSTLLHEMAHSTGAANALNRLRPCAFGSEEYAREELVAELTAAVVGQHYGIVKELNKDAVPYCKSWLKAIRANPAYIFNVLNEVNKAQELIIVHIEDQKKA